MKKTPVLIGLIALLTLAFLGVGVVYAQSTTPPPSPEDGTESPPPSWNRDGFGSRGGYGGMMHGYDQDEASGPMHTAMLTAMAEALGLEPAELEARLETGESMYTVAESLGISPEDFQALMVAARTTAIEQAVQEGWLTQEMADWMQERMNANNAAGLGFGYGHCGNSGRQSFSGRRGGRGMGGGMWAAPQTP